MFKTRAALVLTFLLLSVQKSVTKKAPITLRDGEYTGILVAIDKNIPEDERIIQRIKEIFTEGSAFLLPASHRRAYFKDVTILIPKTWTNKAEYEVAKDESFERAHVIVAEPNPDWGNNPYTLQFGGCGIKGEYIHYTPSYLLDVETSEYIWGPAGRLLIHEWGHLRYGLFDEYFTSYEDVGVQPFYLDRRERLQGTRCSLELTGVNRHAETFSRCSIDRRTGLPEKGCMFFPNLEGQTATASIMYAQYLDTVTTWCHSNTSDPKGLHNRDAPNKQNNICGGKSTMDIILATDDFFGNKNPPIDENEIVDTVPNFRLVQRRERRVVLVLDVSGSMEGEPLTQLLQVSTNYLRNTIDDGSYVGIVEFSEESKILSQLRHVNSSSRENLISNLPKKAEGWTSIGGGIKKGIEVLSSGPGRDAAGGYILLVSDGEENRSPLISDITNEIESSGVIIDTVAFTYQADPQLEEVASNTGGFSYFYSGSDDTTSLHDAFTSTVSRRPEEAVSSLPVQVTSGAMTVPGKQSSIGSVFIDSSLGKSTMFGFTWKSQRVDIELTGPDGTVINKRSNATMYTVDESLKMITITVPGTAMSGKWTYVISNPSNADQVINVGTESRRVTEDSQPILVTSQLSSLRVDFTGDVPYLLIYAKVTKGYNAVVDAHVIAIIDRGNDRRSTLQLFDNGAGADIKRNDGVYSAYFVNITGDGRYSVQIKVENTDGSAQVRKSGNSGSAAFAFRPVPASQPIYQEAELFNRATSAGTFEVSNYDEEMALADMYAPARIIDLEVVSTSFAEKTVTLQWSASGDDLDQGTATEYDLRVSATVDILFDNFHEAHRLDNSSVVEGSLHRPLPAGSKEKITVKVPDDLNNATYRQVFAIRAVDDAGTSGETSNVVTATFYVPQENSNVVIIAVVVVIIVLLIIIVLIVLIICYRRRKSNQSSRKQYSGVGMSDDKEMKSKVETSKKKPKGGRQVMV